MDVIEKHFHSTPVLWFFLVYAAGIALGWLFIRAIPVNILLTALAVLVLCAFLLRRQMLFFLFPAVIILGILRLYFSLAALPKDHLVFQDIKQITAAEGWISGVQYRQDGKNRYVLQCRFTYTDSSRHKTEGRIYLFQGKYKTRLHYGQNIRISSSIQQPPLPGNPGEFNFRKYLQLKGIYFQSYLKEDACTILPGQSGNFLQKEFLALSLK